MPLHDHKRSVQQCPVALRRYKHHTTSCLKHYAPLILLCSTIQTAGVPVCSHPITGCGQGLNSHMHVHIPTHACPLTWHAAAHPARYLSRDKVSLVLYQNLQPVRRIPSENGRPDLITNQRNSTYWTPLCMIRSGKRSVLPPTMRSLIQVMWPKTDCLK